MKESSFLKALKEYQEATKVSAEWADLIIQLSFPHAIFITPYFKIKKHRFYLPRIKDVSIKSRLKCY
jgi:hypothetical protein